MVPPHTPLPTTRPPPAGPPADGGQRTTLVPTFDPQAFARDAEVELGNPAPALAAAPLPQELRPAEPAPPAAPPPPEVLPQLSTPQADPRPIRIPLVRVLRKAAPSPEESAADAALERDCLAAIGSASAVLVVTLSRQELTGLVLDAESGFLLSLMDGATNVETLLDLCGLPRLLALRTLRRLVVRGVAKVGKKA